MRAILIAFLLMASPAFADEPECHTREQQRAVLGLADTALNHTSSANRVVAQEELVKLGCDRYGRECPDSCPITGALSPAPPRRDTPRRRATPPAAPVPPPPAKRETPPPPAAPDTGCPAVWTVARTDGSKNVAVFAAQGIKGRQLTGPVQWALSSGAQVTSGQGTASITVSHRGVVQATASACEETRSATHSDKRHWIKDSKTWLAGGAAAAAFFLFGGGQCGDL